MSGLPVARPHAREGRWGGLRRRPALAADRIFDTTPVSIRPFVTRPDLAPLVGATDRGRPGEACGRRTVDGGDCGALSRAVLADLVRRAEAQRRAASRRHRSPSAAVAGLPPITTLVRGGSGAGAAGGAATSERRLRFGEGDG
jgi:hypothetical protein